MNVLQLSKYYHPIRGGIETVAAQFSRAHLNLGDKNYVISFGAEYKKYSGEFKENVTQIKQDFFLASTPISFNFHKQFLKYLLENKIDLIYVHLPNPYMHQLLAWMKNKIKIRIIGIYHSDIVNQKYLGPLYMSYFKCTSGFYNKIICSSQNLKNSSSYLRSLNSEVYSLAFPIDGHPDAKIKKQTTGHFLYVGRLVPYKGLEFLIKCFSNIPFNLTIIGDGPIRKNLESMATSNVCFLGEVSEAKKMECFNQLDALILSSINNAEAYGMVLAEALERGMPVLAPNIPTGVTFLARHRQTGLVFDVLNEGQLISSIYEIQENSDLFSMLSKNARAFYEQYLTPQIFLENLNQLINSKNS